MKLQITNARIIDPASGLDTVGSVCVADEHIVSLGAVPAGFVADSQLDATGCIAIPGLVDLHARLREPGFEHEKMLSTELAAAVAGGVTSLVCPPDTEPVLDEAGLVQTLRSRAKKQGAARVFPLGALTRGLKGEALSEMVQLSEAGCVGFSQANTALIHTQTLIRAAQYASTHHFPLWLHPLDPDLGKAGVAASGALATRMGLSGVPVWSETISLNTIFDVVRATGVRVHLMRMSSARGVDLLRAAKAEGLPITADVSMHSLHLTDMDVGYFDSHARLTPPLRQQADRVALRTALADGTIDALVSDHMPAFSDEKALPFAQATAGASGLECLLSLVVKWSTDDHVPLPKALQCVTSQAAQVLLGGRAAGSTLGHLQIGAVADICVFNPATYWTVQANTLRSQGKHTPWLGYELPAQVRATVVAGHVVHHAAV